MRDREQTERKILVALGRQLSRSGFRGIGVNAIARQAGVDKVLIYRYFGGMRGLLETYARQGDFWPRPEELMPSAEEVDRLTATELAKLLLERFGEALRKRPITQEIMRWELHEQNELTDVLADYRERQGIELLRRIGAPDSSDVLAIGAVLGAAQTYLILRAKTARFYNGIDLHSEEGWRRLVAAMGLLIEVALLDPAERATTGEQGV